jgi:hypothetical protein
MSCHGVYPDAFAPHLVDSADMDTAPFAQLAAILDSHGLLAGLEFLNARVDFRFTGLYKLEKGLVRKICLVDKRGGTGLPFHNEVNLEQSLSRYALRDGMFKAEDVIVDERLASYRFAGMIGSCFIVKLIDPDERPWGTLIHFDMINRTISDAEAGFLLQTPLAFRRFL